ncbi:Unknown protein [Striga hermonthica]|uniref:Uncharacterized protein n=1 Tax=Striga hermonthica TaxID=68872 RepID=A0A9N7MKZ7_STRHE|nr:Unknown protein [Striga hermonthica]
MVTQLLLLSLSVFSLLFSCSSLFSSPFFLSSQNLHYNINISPNTLHILSLVATNKNCIFLVCNTLFFLVTKTSASVVSCSPPDSGSNEVTLHEGADDFVGLEPELVPVSDKDMIIVYENESRAKETKTNGVENDGGKELACPTQVSIFIADSHEEEEEDAKREDLIENDESGVTETCCLFYDEDEDDDAGDDVLSAEELNQKFEDFIRRMKEEIRLSEAEIKSTGSGQQNSIR